MDMVARGWALLAVGLMLVSVAVGDLPPDNTPSLRRYDE
jgi:hypothetical protein